MNDKEYSAQVNFRDGRKLDALVSTMWDMRLTVGFTPYNLQLFNKAADIIYNLAEPYHQKCRICGFWHTLYREVCGNCRDRVARMSMPDAKPKDEYDREMLHKMGMKGWVPPA